MTTDLLSRLRAHIDRDQCVSYDWGEPKHDAGQDCADAIEEIERLNQRVKWLEDYSAAQENEIKLANQRLAQCREEYAACIKTVDQLENGADDATAE